jgi:hypothetical protein
VRDLTELRFTKIPTRPRLQGNIASAGVRLPDAYLDFLQFDPPADLNLAFLFVDPTTGEEWEGQIVEIMAYTDDQLDRAVVTISRGGQRIILPIACDAGGNYLYLELSQSPPRVVTSSDSGSVVVVAPNFEAFMESVYLGEEE